MVEKCSAGSQNCCDLEFMSKVNDMSISGQDANVTIHLKGQITSAMVNHNLFQCDCYVE